MQKTNIVNPLFFKTLTKESSRASRGSFSRTRRKTRRGGMPPSAAMRTEGVQTQQLQRHQLMSADFMWPHGQRIGTGGGRYFVVLVVRPDLSGGRRDAASQVQVDAAPVAGGAPVAHEAGGAIAGGAPVAHEAGPGADDGGQDQQPQGQPAEDVKSYDPQNPLIYVEVVEFKNQAAEAVIRMIALMREELGRFSTSLPSDWTIHRLHCDKGSELLPKTLD